MSERIRVLVAAPSLLCRTLVGQALAADPRLVSSPASSAAELRARLAVGQPELLVADADIWAGGGASGLRKLFAGPVLEVGGDPARGCRSGQTGVWESLPKPRDMGRGIAARAFQAELLARAQALVGLRGVEPPVAPPEYGFDGVVAIGASTGGTQAIGKILRTLPADFPGVVIVQHMPVEFTKLYADNLDRECAMSVREARDGDLVRPGLALLAPGSLHMRLVRQGGDYAVRCVSGAKVNGHCPSVDELFFSVARAAGDRAVGVILTGMGGDGAKGLREMRGRGAYTIGQDKETCVVYGMPKEAYDLGAVKKQLPLGKISELLTRLVREGF